MHKHYSSQPRPTTRPRGWVVTIARRLKTYVENQEYVLEILDENLSNNVNEWLQEGPAK